MKTKPRLGAVIAGVMLMLMSAAVALGQTGKSPEGLVGRLPSAEQQQTVAEQRRSSIGKAQGIVEEARSQIADAAGPIAQGRAAYESNPTAENAVNMLQACVYALKSVAPQVDTLGQAAGVGGTLSKSQVADIARGEREIAMSLTFAGLKMGDLKNVEDNYESLLQQLRARHENSASLTPSQELVIKGAIFNAKLAKRATEHSTWTYGELLAALQELQIAKASIASREAGFNQLAVQAKTVGAHFKGMLGNFESVLTAWKSSGEIREFDRASGKLFSVVEETLKGLVDLVADESMPSMPSRPVIQTRENQEGQTTLDLLRFGDRPAVVLGAGGAQ